VPRTVENRPRAREGEQRAFPVEREPYHVLFFVSGFGCCGYSAKLLTGIKHRFSALSHARQCGDEVLRMFVTGYPPARGGGGIPQRIIVISSSPPELRTTGAG